MLFHTNCLFYVAHIPHRFTNFEDKEWFEACLKRVVNQHVGEDHMADLLLEPYFVDFMQDAPEPTGDEPDDAELEAPKIYEMVCVMIL